MKRLRLKEGDIIGNNNIKYVRELPFYRQPCGDVKRVCEFKCDCGNVFKSLLSDVKKGRRKSCGCKKGALPKKYKKGDVINGIKLIKSLGTTKYAQRAIFVCPICGNEWESYVSNIQSGNTKSCCGIKRGWSRSQWTKAYKRAFLYKVRLYNDSESFIKIGITSKEDIRKRFLYIPYKYEVIKIISGEARYIFDLENRIKMFFKKYKYSPLIHFRGDSECFKQ